MTPTPKKLKQVSDQFFDNNDLIKAVEYFNKIFQSSEKSKYYELITLFLIRHLIYATEYKKAKDIIYENKRNKNEYSLEYIYCKAQIKYYDGRFFDAISMLENQLLNFKNLNQYLSKNCYLNIGDIYLLIGKSHLKLNNNKTAIIFLKKSLGFFKSKNQSYKVYLSVNFIGNAVLNMGHLKDAQKILQLCLRNFKRLFPSNNHFRIGCCLGDIGLCKKLIENRKPIKNFSEAIKILNKSFENNLNRHIASVYKKMAMVSSKDDIALIEFYRKELNIRQNTQGLHHPSISAVLNKIAYYYLNSDPAKCLENVQKAIIANVKGFNDSDFNTTINVTDVKLIDSFLIYLNSIIIKINCLTLMTDDLHTNLGIAENEVDSCLNLIEDYQHEFSYDYSQEVLGTQLREFYDLTLNLYLKLRNSNKGLNQHFEEKIFKITELAKNLRLLENVRQNLKLKTLKSVERTNDRIQLSTISIKNILPDIKKLLRNDNDKINELASLPIEGFKLKMQATKKEFKSSLKVINLLKMVEGLSKSKEVAIISFHLTSNKLFTFSIDSDRYKFYCSDLNFNIVKSRDDVKKLFSDYLNYFNKTNLDVLVEPEYMGNYCLMSNLIYSIFFKNGFLKNLPKRIKRIYFVLDDEIPLIPFETLVSKLEHTPNLSDLNYFIKKYQTISYHHSVSLLNISIEKSNEYENPNNNLLGLSTYSKATMKSVEEELDFIREIFLYNNVDTNVNPMVNKQELLELLKNNKFIHFTGHYEEDIFEDSNGIILSKVVDNKLNQSLYIDDIYSLELERTLLILLCYCNSNFKIESINKIISFPLTFLQAGVHNIIFTIFKVLTKDTLLMTKIFYRNLLHGKSIATSLHEAKIDMLYEDKYPFCWAGLVFIGNQSDTMKLKEKMKIEEVLIH